MHVTTTGQPAIPGCCSRPSKRSTQGMRFIYCRISTALHRPACRQTATAGLGCQHQRHRVITVVTTCRAARPAPRLPGPAQETRAGPSSRGHRHWRGRVLNDGVCWWRRRTCPVGVVVPLLLRACCTQLVHCRMPLVLLWRSVRRLLLWRHVGLQTRAAACSSCCSSTRRLLPLRGG
jgi:hypothetical protein